MKHISKGTSFVKIGWAFFREKMGANLVVISLHARHVNNELSFSGNFLESNCDSYSFGKRILAVSKGTTLKLHSLPKMCGFFPNCQVNLPEHVGSSLCYRLFSQRSLAGGTPDCRRVVIIGTVDIDLGGCHHFLGWTKTVFCWEDPPCLDISSRDVVIDPGIYSHWCLSKLFALEDSDWCFCLLPFLGIPFCIRNFLRGLSLNFFFLLRLENHGTWCLESILS